MKKFIVAVALVLSTGALSAATLTVNHNTVTSNKKDVGTADNKKDVGTADNKKDVGTADNKKDVGTADNKKDVGTAD
ncbi:hypothetical protein EWM62_17855 [Mucilaginibacter terrigena]|uniref:Pentapeptide MXKDX repeat protein n=1 Tax=Mucilaginibacter terrigena TaxID=2492395 RepID=A0A4Q5LIR3_9SPHI|nr:hypothetical protein [Mucilaginibacter terrigena]RYU86519.1 hypothetical protein EWM62_17855 [Mucilaginibacter terrigena]